MKKIKLKTGMLVETRDSNLRIILGKSAVSLNTVNVKGGFDLNRLNKKLKDKGNRMNDIVKVYSSPEGSLQANMTFLMNNQNILLNHSKLIWERS